MKKNISTQHLKTRIGEVIDEVRLRGDRYIIERRGKPVAALVPLAVDEAYEANRTKLFALMNKVANKNRGVPASKIEESINQAVTEVRRKKRHNGNRA